MHLWVLADLDWNHPGEVEHGGSALLALNLISEWLACSDIFSHGYDSNTGE